MREVKAFGDRIVCGVTEIGIESEAQRLIVSQCLSKPLFSNLKPVTKRRVVEAEGRGTWHSTRHVGHTVVNHSINHVSRVLVGGGVARRNTTPLIH